MVKQAEQLKKRNPLLPVFGIIIAVGLFGLALSLVNPITIFVKQRGVVGFDMPAPVGGVTFPNTDDPKSTLRVTLPSWPRLGLAFALWLIFLALAYTLVAVLGGRDPNSQKGVKLPPRGEIGGRGRRR